jgi:hypothetical protein
VRRRNEVATVFGTEPAVHWYQRHHAHKRRRETACGHLLSDFEQHYNCERYHQGLGGKLVITKVNVQNDNGGDGKIKTRSRLGGILNFYHRKAA